MFFPFKLLLPALVVVVISLQHIESPGLLPLICARAESEISGCLSLLLSGVFSPAVGSWYVVIEVNVNITSWLCCRGELHSMLFRVVLIIFTGTSRRAG